MDEFRLIQSPPMSGAHNMALDEALLESIAAGHSAPTIRLYAWIPPCLSLGYAQSIEDVDLEALKAAEWDLVRRPTGGKAILHIDELTYSIAGPVGHPLLQDGVLASYRRLSAGLLAGLRRFGLQPELQAAVTAPNGKNPICFQDPGAYELTVAGKKLLGSAQLRRAGGVLQHGSLPLAGDITRICRVLSYPDGARRAAAAEELQRVATTLEAAAGRAFGWRAAAGELAAGFVAGLELELVPGDPTPAELRRADQLAAERYGSSQWNLRR